MNGIAAALEGSFLGRYFRFADHGTNIARDTLAGATTFVVMAYIIFVNPTILSFLGIEGLQERGLPFQAVLASTCVVAGTMSILMGLATNKAFAIAPGMGLNAVVAFGLVATAGLSCPEAMGDLLLGIIGTTIFATILNWGTGYAAFDLPGVARWPEQIAATPDLSLVGEFSFGSFATLGIVATLVWVFALFLADFFDTMGTLVGVGKPAGYVKPDGNIEGLRGLLVVDSLGAIAGGAASASSATTYIESGAGVAAGGRTGWASVVTGFLFFPFLFFAR